MGASAIRKRIRILWLKGKRFIELRPRYCIIARHEKHSASSDSSICLPRRKRSSLIEVCESLRKIAHFDVHPATGAESDDAARIHFERVIAVLQSFAEFAKMCKGSPRLA